MADGTEVLLTIGTDGITAAPLPVVSLATAGLLERQHLQEWIIANPQILGLGVMVVAVEYDGWMVAGSAQRDRLDVLGMDRDGRLVVAELKRGIAADTVEMQAVKYAAMASRFRTDTLAAAYADFNRRRGTSMTTDQAIEALQTHAEGFSDETLNEPRVVVVAAGFSPVVISSVVWLANRGVDLALVRFQPYRHADGTVLVTFSQLFPLPDLEKSIVAPGAPAAEISTERLPYVEWSEQDLVALGRVANPTTRTVLDLCAERPGVHVSLSDVVTAAGIERPAARGQLAGLTMVIKRRFGRRNWPFTARWAAEGDPQAYYMMTAEAAALWRQATAQLDAEHSDDKSEQLRT